MMRTVARMATLFATMAAVAIATVPAQAGAVRDVVTERLSQRLFPLFDGMARDPAAVRALVSKADIAALLDSRQQRVAGCAQDMFCVAQALIWTETDIDTVSKSVAAPAGLTAPDDGVAAQARREMEGINIIVRTYGLGAPAAYAQIDGAGTIDPQERQARLQAAYWLSRTPRDTSAQALDPSIDYALALLDGSDRTDAIGFEPLTGGANAAAMARAKSLDWSRYRYSALIVTGVGPEVPDMAISPFGKYHLRLAAYARHTTTNLRNATRLLMAMDAPMDRDAVIVSNPGQSASIESPQFVTRNQRELGYQPGQVGRRLSITELLFRPSRVSARIDPRDPLDP